MQEQALCFSEAHLLGGLAAIREAALDRTPISGLTHCFYRYPARFSPAFAGAVIDAFSQPGDLVLDPYMGGGTTVVEAAVRDRFAVGCDLNSLAVFVAKIKTTPLSEMEAKGIRSWVGRKIPGLLFSSRPGSVDALLGDPRARNMGLPSVRAIKKLIALCLDDIANLPSATAQNFVRGILLNVGQWALNGRRVSVTACEFRSRLSLTTETMLEGMRLFAKAREDVTSREPILLHDTASNLPFHIPFKGRALADLVVCSPPYPGIHVLYHRWQVDGRKESAAPYWIANRVDGNGAAFYNFKEDRRAKSGGYFLESLVTLQAIREVVRKGAVFAQMVAFSQRRKHLAQYLDNMKEAGFREIRTDELLGQARHRRIWREVPGRRWHANMKGSLCSSREVVLLHQAI